MAVETTSLRPRVAKYQSITKWFWRTAILVSIGWNIYEWRHLNFNLPRLRHDAWASVVALFDRLPVLGVLYVIFEVAFCVGATMMIIGLGQKVFTKGWLSSIRMARQRVRELVQADSTTKTYRAGFYLNLAGAAMTTGIIPIIAIMLLLPFNRWGSLVGIPLADLASTFIWRIAVQPRKRAEA